MRRPPTEGPEDVGGRRRRARYEPDPPSRVSAAKKASVEAENSETLITLKKKKCPARAPGRATTRVIARCPELAGLGL